MEKTFIDERMLAMPTLGIVKLEKETQILWGSSLEILELALQDLCGEAGKNYVGIKEAQKKCEERLDKAKRFQQELLQSEFLNEEFSFRLKKINDIFKDCKEILEYIPSIEQQIFILQNSGKEFPNSLGVEFSFYCENIEKGMDLEKSLNDFLEENSVKFAKEDEKLAIAFVYAVSILQDLMQMVKTRNI